MLSIKKLFCASVVSSLIAVSHAGDCRDAFYDYLYPMNQTLQNHLKLKASFGKLSYPDGEIYETPKGHFGFNTMAPFVVIDGQIIASPSLDLKFIDHYNLTIGANQVDFAGYWKVINGRIVRLKIGSEAYPHDSKMRKEAMQVLRGLFLIR